MKRRLMSMALIAAMIMSLFTAGLSAVADGGGELHDDSTHTENADGWTCTRDTKYSDTPDACTATPHECGPGAGCDSVCVNQDHAGGELTCDNDSENCQMSSCTLPHTCSIEQGCYSVTGYEWRCEEPNASPQGPAQLAYVPEYVYTDMFGTTETVAIGGAYSSVESLKQAAFEKIVHNGACYTRQEGHTEGAEDGGKVTVTLNYVQETQTISLVKRWEDFKNIYGHRPQNVTIEAYYAGTAQLAGTVELTPPQADISGLLPSYPEALLPSLWVGSITLPKYSANDMDNIAGYEFRDAATSYNWVGSVAGRQDDIVVINQLDYEEIECVFVKKVWNDNNASGKRPEKILIYVVNQDGIKFAEKELTETGGWQTDFPRLPSIVAGVTQTYTVHEENVPGYTYTGATFTITKTPKTDDLGGIKNPIIVTNTTEEDPTPEYVSLKVTKVWDQSVPANDIPESITVQLLRNGTPVSGRTLTLSDVGSWTGTFSNLDKYDNRGTRYAYSIEEIDPGDFTVRYGSVTENGNNYEIVLTNSKGDTPDPEYVTLNVLKVWENAPEDIMPFSVQFQLLANGVPVGGRVLTVSEATGWRGSFTGLPKNDAGGEIEYSITEVDPGAFTPWYSALEKDGNTYSIVATNEYLTLTDPPVPEGSAPPPSPAPSGTGTFITIEDGDVPLSDSPKTSDGVNPVLLWALLMMGMLGIGVTLTIDKKRRTDK